MGKSENFKEFIDSKKWDNAAYTLFEAIAYKNIKDIKKMIVLNPEFCCTARDSEGRTGIFILKELIESHTRGFNLDILDEFVNAKLKIFSDAFKQNNLKMAKAVLFNAISSEETVVVQRIILLNPEFVWDALYEGIKSLENGHTTTLPRSCGEEMAEVLSDGFSDTGIDFINRQDYFDAIKERKIEKVTEMITSNPELLNCKYQGNRTGILLARDLGFTEIFDLLVRTKIKIFINAKQKMLSNESEIGADREVKEVFFNAVCSGETETVKEMVLLDPDYCSCVKDMYGRTGIRLAKDLNYTNILNVLVDAKLEMFSEAIQRSDIYEASNVFFNAIRGNEAIVVEKMISFNPIFCLDALDENGYTGITLADRLKLQDVFNILVSAKLKMFSETVQGNDMKSAAKVFCSAINAGETEVVKNILKKQDKKDWIAYINSTDNLGNTVLMMAVKRGQKEIVEDLIKYGSDVNAANRYGLTALMVAAGSGNIDMVKLLLENKADRMAKDKEGNIAQVYAERNRHKLVGEKLRPIFTALLIPETSSIESIVFNKHSTTLSSELSLTNSSRPEVTPRLSVGSTQNNLCREH